MEGHEFKSQTAREEMSKKGLQQHIKFSIHHKLTQIIILPLLFQPERNFIAIPDLIQRYKCIGPLFTINNVLED